VDFFDSITSRGSPPVTSVKVGADRERRKGCGASRIGHDLDVGEAGRRQHDRFTAGRVRDQCADLGGRGLRRRPHACTGTSRRASRRQHVDRKRRTGDRSPGHREIQRGDSGIEENAKIGRWIVAGADGGAGQTRADRRLYVRGQRARAHPQGRGTVPVADPNRRRQRPAAQHQACADDRVAFAIVHGRIHQSALV
jgi:hypothetical protein